VFLLMTDALAGWFLRKHEAGRTAWRTLLDLDARDGPAFAEGIARQRALRAVRDDDVALLRVQVAGGI
jgi:hypothetical protein